jgi:hypothetical protein
MSLMGQGFAILKVRTKRSRSSTLRSTASIEHPDPVGSASFWRVRIPTKCIDHLIFFRQKISKYCPKISENKELKYFLPKNCYQAFGNMIQCVYLGSRIRIRIRNQRCSFWMFIPDSGSKFSHPGTRVKKILDPHKRI